jgi:hypothetical protein
VGKLTFRGTNQRLADAAVSILKEEKPMTLRQLFYRCVSAGLLKNCQPEYKRLGKIMTRLREAHEVPLNWIVDHIRATLKPSSWSGLEDFSDTVRQAYRKDFWASLPRHVEVFVEKDAIAGTVQPITHEYDVALRVVRGYCSLSFVGEIAAQWAEIDKPIHAYYIGDYDPSGFDLERDLFQKIEQYSGREAWCPSSEWTIQDLVNESNELNHANFCWYRLAVNRRDFWDHQLIPLPVKHTDRRAKGFLDKHGTQCAEVDALPPTELRRRVEEAIISHIPTERWEKLKKTEEVEKESLERYLSGWASSISNGT